MSSDQKRNRIVFQQEQIEWLERIFQEVSSLAEPLEMAHRAGQRSVLARIKQESQVEVRYVPIRRDVP